MLVVIKPDSRGSSPAMTVERKFANVFMASSASGNIRVIKFRDDAGWLRRYQRTFLLVRSLRAVILSLTASAAFCAAFYDFAV